VIRDAQPGDVGDILRLVRALAEYEREPDAVEANETSLSTALFRPDPLVHAMVAEEGGRVVGMAVWFLSYSTWTGRHSLYLEDLFVEPERRARGVGRALMRHLAVRAAELGCARMDWSVLDWNEPAMTFYRSLGARPMDEWTTWRLDGPALDALGTAPPG
jgi:GNAT superfamily N-acetyltransferase